MDWFSIVLVVYAVGSFIAFCFAMMGAAHSHGAAGFGSVLLLTFLWPYVLLRVAISYMR